MGGFYIYIWPMTTTENITEIQTEITNKRQEIEKREIQIAQLESTIRGIRAMNKLDERIIKLYEGNLELMQKLNDTNP